MKLLSDVSTVLKLALVCLAVGFVAGFCSSNSVEFPTVQPSPSPSVAEDLATR